MTFTSYNLFMRDIAKSGIEYAVEHAKALGFSGVEFLDFCGTSAPVDKKKYPASELKKALDENGLTIDCYSVYAYVLSDDIDQIYGIIDYAAEVGAQLFHHTLMPYLKLGPDMPKYDDIFPKVLEIERRIVKYCSERGLKCIFEPQGFYFNGDEGLSKIICALREEFPDVGLCADLGNPVFVDCDPKDVIDKLSFCIEHVHVKDYIIADALSDNKGAMLSRCGKYLYEVLPGEGVIDLGACLKAIKATGYDGRIALEYLGDDETIRESMQYIKNLWEE